MTQAPQPYVFPLTLIEARNFADNFRLGSTVGIISPYHPFRDYDPGMWANVNLFIESMQRESLDPRLVQGTFLELLPLEYLDETEGTDRRTKTFATADGRRVEFSFLLGKGEQSSDANFFEIKAEGYPNVSGRLGDEADVSHLNFEIGNVILGNLRLPESLLWSSGANYYCAGNNWLMAVKGATGEDGKTRLYEFAVHDGRRFFFSPAVGGFCLPSGAGINVMGLADGAIGALNPFTRIPQI